MNLIVPPRELGCPKVLRVSPVSAFPQKTRAAAQRPLSTSRGSGSSRSLHTADTSLQRHREFGDRSPWTAASGTRACAASACGSGCAARAGGMDGGDKGGVCSDDLGTRGWPRSSAHGVLPPRSAASSARGCSLWIVPARRLPGSFSGVQAGRMPSGRDRPALRVQPLPLVAASLAYRVRREILSVSAAAWRRPVRPQSVCRMNCRSASASVEPVEPLQGRPAPRRQ